MSFVGCVAEIFVCAGPSNGITSTAGGGAELVDVVVAAGTGSTEGGACT